MNNLQQPLVSNPAQSRMANLPDAKILIRLFERMALLRKFETAAQVACRKGETPGFLHLYIGQEATGTGVCDHLRPGDWITSTHRGHGHALAKGSDPRRVMAELFGRSGGICGGRGGTMHLYDRSVGLFGTNGVVAAGIGHAVGIGLSARQRGVDDIAVAFFGDGAVNHGAFHESLNFASVQGAPVVFVCENNLYATATPFASTTLNTDVASKAAAYGCPGYAVDGNDVFAVWQVMMEATARARAGDGPTLIEARTYRTVGHHEGDPVVGTYRTKEEIDAWVKRDPIKNFRSRLVEEFSVATNAELDEIEVRVDELIDECVTFARSSPLPDSSTASAHVFADPLNPHVALTPQKNGATVLQGWLDAVRDGIAEEMRANPNIIYLGEGTGERGGSFAHTKNLWQEFGSDRMIDTPISEQGFTAAAIGASATGTRAVADLMFADFAFEAAGQIFQQAAKLRYMSNGSVSAPVVIRAAAGALRSSGPHHSGSYHPIFAHVPGLVVCVPSNAADAKGLMKTALRASDPVIMLEPKALFSSKCEVPAESHFIPFGYARVMREGHDITILATGQLVARALEAAEDLAKCGVEAEIVDPRTILPLDVDTIVSSLEKTHRILVVDEAWAMCGLGGEIAQMINELAFDELDAPVGRLHTSAVVHPFSPVLESAILVDAARIVDAALAVIGGRAPISNHWFSQQRLGSAVALPSAGSPFVAHATAPVKGPEAHTNSSGELIEPIVMPFGDLTVSEGKLVAWHKSEGEFVEEGELIAEVETDKAVVEVEASVSGRMGPHELDVGAIVAMGGRIGSIL